MIIYLGFLISRVFILSFLPLYNIAVLQKDKDGTFQFLVKTMDKRVKKPNALKDKAVTHMNPFTESRIRDSPLLVHVTETHNIVLNKVLVVVNAVVVVVNVVLSLL